MRWLLMSLVVSLCGCAVAPTLQQLPPMICEVHNISMSLADVEVGAELPPGERARYLSARAAEFPHHGEVSYFPMTFKAQVPVCSECSAAFRRWLASQRKTPNQALQPTRMLVTFRAYARPVPSTRVADL